MPHVAVIGAGPAGLMAAERLAQGGARVTVSERMPSAGRKFLMAGRGGLNLTHSEPIENFLSRYGEAAAWLRDSVSAFPPQALRAWCEALGQETFVGSSGRVFPKAMKASPLLRAWLRRLDAQGVRLMLRHVWKGWDADGHLVFDAPGGVRQIEADAVVLALGGASWPKLGSDGAWTKEFERHGIAVAGFRPANCGFHIAWSEVFRDRFEGAPLKNVILMHGEARSRGDVIVTRQGLEGGAIYPLSARLRDAIAAHGEATLRVALRPDVPVDSMVERLSAPRGKQSLATFLRKALGLSPLAIALLHESARAEGRTLTSLSPRETAEHINALPLQLIGIAPLARAISSAGGIARDELDERLMLRKLPGVFACGEMIDWEAPTGGYLLQASFALGVSAGEGTLQWLKERK
ncbi:MAG: TIGR03862 family flavoprotein [Xanthobacteraceae bacterium]